MILAKALSRSARGRRATRLAAISLGALSIWGAVGCGQGPGGQSIGQTAQAQTAAPSGTAVLGFETTAGWTVSSGDVSLSTTAFTQGTAALAVTAPQNYTTLVSAPLASGLAPLAGLTSPGATVEIDMELPTAQPNPFYLGALQVFVSSPSHGVYNQYLGQALLTGRPLGVFQTYTFPVSSFVQTQLAGGNYSDLTFTVALNAPSGATGTYLFDNLRTASPATAAIGAGSSVNLVAMLSQSPTTNTPGTASFTPGTIQVPASFHVTTGDAGHGTALFELGNGSTTTVSCTYAASPDATAYLFQSCSTANVAGDLVAANTASLTIQSADPAAPLTKVKAQLAYNALGDLVGTHLLVPVPTFWGETLSDINTIGNAFINAESATPPASPFVTLPVPDYAINHGTGAPVNVANGLPPPPGDPIIGPFRGDMNPGSNTFNAYWTFSGNFSGTSANNDFQTTLNTDQSAHVVVFGGDANVVEVTAQILTDNGQLSGTNFVNPSATANLGVFIFGDQLPGSPYTVNGNVGFTFPGFPLKDQQTQSVPVFQWLIFSLNVGLTETLQLNAQGKIAFDGPTVTLTPEASIGATISAQVNIGVASGSVNATVQFLDVTLPLSASALWAFNSTPDVCQADLTFDVNGQVKLSTLGGNVAATVVLGPSFAPIWKQTFTIFKWNGVTLAQTQLFDINSGPGQFTALPQSLCNVPLDVTIQEPTANANVFAGVGVQASALATRPSSQLSGPALPTTVDCSFVTWTSSDPNATFSPSNVGCTPVVTFSPGTAGSTQTLTATATDKFKETGSASVTVDVGEAPSGPVPAIFSPTPGERFGANTEINVTGAVTGGTGTVTAVWTSTSAATAPATTILGTVAVTAGANVPVSLPTAINSGGNGSQTITLTVTDSSGASNATSVTFNVEAIQ